MTPTRHLQRGVRFYVAGITAVIFCGLGLFAVRVYAQKAEQDSRVAAARETLAKYLGDGAIPGATMDEVLKVVREAGDHDIEPLMRRLRLLDKAGADYAEDFTLWWNEKGRREVGGAVLWDRASLR